MRLQSERDFQAGERGEKNNPARRVALTDIACGTDSPAEAGGGDVQRHRLVPLGIVWIFLGSRFIYNL